jgi:hypothetical protein
MLTARQAAQRTALLAEQHVVEQEARIDRQRKLIVSLSNGEHERMLREAHRLLVAMELLLVQMNDSLTRAQERLDRLSGAAREGHAARPPAPTSISL